jgi:hypothetical protein
VSRPALLDVNLLVALFDPDHVHHDLAHEWFAENRDRGWATCPVTENGFVRVLSNPAYGNTVRRPADLVARLRKFCRSGHHQFWPDAVSLTDETLFDQAFVGGPRQVTDVYLLGLAKRRGGRLATFDRTIPRKAVMDGERDLVELIAPADEA